MQACSRDIEDTVIEHKRMGKKGKWFSAVKKVFGSSDPDGKQAKVCQNSLLNRKNAALVIIVLSFRSV